METRQFNTDASICGCGGLNSLEWLSVNFSSLRDTSVQVIQILWGWESCYNLLQSWCYWTTRFEWQMASHPAASTSCLSSSSLCLLDSLRVTATEQWGNDDALDKSLDNIWIREVKHWILFREVNQGMILHNWSTKYGPTFCTSYQPDMLPRTNHSPQLGSGGYIHGYRFDVKQESGNQDSNWLDGNHFLRLPRFLGTSQTQWLPSRGEGITIIPIIISLIPVLEAKSTVHGIFVPSRRTSGITYRTFRLPTSQGGLV
jgi:hypothetical protein